MFRQQVRGWVMDAARMLVLLPFRRLVVGYGHTASSTDYERFSIAIPHCNQSVNVSIDQFANSPDSPHVIGQRFPAGRRDFQFIRPHRMSDLPAFRSPCGVIGGGVFGTVFPSVLLLPPDGVRMTG